MTLEIAKYAMRHIRIGGRSLYPLPILTYCQTDASYKPRNVFVATHIQLPNRTYLEYMRPIYSVNNSTEAEWASVLFGIEACIENNQRVIGLENDNLSVIAQLMRTDYPPKKDYAKFYRNKIYNLAAHTEWTGVRWTPRELNFADKIMRRQER